MYPTLYTEIRNILEKCTGTDGTIAQLFAHPVKAKDITAYPAAIFYPTQSQSSFETNKENEKIYGYKVVILVNAEVSDKTMNEIFEEILANAAEDVENKFDANWGTNIDAHRGSVKVDSSRWDALSTDDGVIAFAELVIRIKILKTN